MDNGNGNRNGTNIERKEVLGRRGLINSWVGVCGGLEDWSRVVIDLGSIFLVFYYICDRILVCYYFLHNTSYYKLEILEIYQSFLNTY